MGVTGTAVQTALNAMAEWRLLTVSCTAPVGASGLRAYKPLKEEVDRRAFLLLN
jgi:hypothetical protein